MKPGIGNIKFSLLLAFFALGATACSASKRAERKTLNGIWVNAISWEDPSPRWQYRAIQISEKNKVHLVQVPAEHNGMTDKSEGKFFGSLERQGKNVYKLKAEPNAEEEIKSAELLSQPTGYSEFVPKWSNEPSEPPPGELDLVLTSTGHRAARLDRLIGAEIVGSVDLIKVSRGEIETRSLRSARLSETSPDQRGGEGAFVNLEFPRDYEGLRLKLSAVEFLGGRSPLPGLTLGREKDGFIEITQCGAQPPEDQVVFARELVFGQEAWSGDLEIPHLQGTSGFEYDAKKSRIRIYATAKSGCRLDLQGFLVPTSSGFKIYTKSDRGHAIFVFLRSAAEPG